MVAATVIGKDANGHEVDELSRVPEMEVLRAAADQISANEYVHNSTNEGYLFTQADSFGIIPLSAKLVHALPHSLSISVELFVGGWDPSPPFFHHSIASILSF